MRVFSDREAAVLDFLRTPSLRYELLRSAVAFGVLMAAGFLMGQLQPAFRDQLIGQYGVDAETAGITSIDLLGSGLITCGIGILLGFVPFAQLPALLLGANALLLGMLLSWYGGQGCSPLVCLLAIVPHGVFQIPAMVLAFAMGLHLCGIITDCVRSKRMDSRLKPALNIISDTYFQLLLPALAASALVELFVTPRLLSLFQ